MPSGSCILASLSQCVKKYICTRLYSVLCRWSWAQFQGGLQEFVEEVRNRRERRKLEGQEKEMPASAIGPESLIVAAACYDFKTL